MSAAEFGEWQVILRNEQMHPAADVLRHAQLMAATLNGPVSRKAGGLFTARELMQADPWAEPPAAPAAPTAQDLAAQVARMNREMGA